jgi:hypothetical protein
MGGRPIPVREMLRFLQGCDPDHDIWVTTQEDMEFDTEKMSLVTGYAYEDQDDEMSRELGRKYNGQPFLRRPILRVETNEVKPNYDCPAGRMCSSGHCVLRHPPPNPGGKPQ